MPQKKRMGGTAAADPAWKGLYLAGSICSLVFLVLVVIPLVLLAAVPPVPSEGGAVLEYIVSHKAAYLAQLVCFVGLSVPALAVFLALGLALKQVDRSLAAVGALAGISSEVIALALGSSPQSLHGGLVLLAERYAVSAGGQRAALAASADALVAATNAVSWAGILTAAAILLLSLAMRKGIYRKAVAWIGIVTGALGILSEAFRPMVGMGYLLYGLLLPAWFVMVGWKLFALRR